MEIKLYEHNKIAYESAAAMLETEGKAAIIHPTGTGKSFIAFKLAAEHPDARVLWLAPSEYIFSTQLENLRDECSGSAEDEPGNIHFMTYTRLMLEEEFIDGLNPDYIILDEFHRCGAAEWGRSVQKLLDVYPDAKVLGLSATSIRYLDGKRDMAQELFGGRTASEMSLGKAISMGVLPAPVYVMSMYSYSEELARLSRRIGSLKNAAVRSDSEEILERLRRALEKADGLDKIFARYMRRDGKYIVFCSDKEHMDEMLDHRWEWFGKVDADPHTYTAYYDNPETDRQFDAFKRDDSDHLKLLYCIDMLNEGVHVSDVDGVILLRPTVSPILYMQQIGRALSAGRKKQPVIFDIVNNFDNLYSIDSIEQEMEEAFSLIPCGQAEKMRIERNFRIIDEVRECRLLFEELNRKLTATWDIYYNEAVEYLNRHGNFRVPKNYITDSGLNLWAWIQTQKKIRAGSKCGTLTDIQIAKLDALGMVWDSRMKESWGRGFLELEKYVKRHGNADVKARFYTEDGYALGKWVCYIRARRNEPEEDGGLSGEQIKELDRLGMIWKKSDQRTEQYLRAAEDYFLIYGNLDVPGKYVTEDGIGLGNWLDRLRRQYRQGSGPDEECLERLGRLGMVWDTKYDSAWDEKYRLASRYYRENGNLNVPSHYVIEDTDLGKWVAAVRYKRKKLIAAGRDLKPDRIEALDSIGMDWK